MLPIAIDYGTFRTKCACPDQAGKPMIIPNARGEESTNSIVYFPPSGDPYVGSDAEAQGFLDPQNCIRNFKLKLGSTENLLSNGRSVTATEAAAVMIKNAKKDAEAFLNMEIIEAVVTCPANFQDNSKQALLDACRQAGIKVLKLIFEPTAAGIAYALDKQGMNTTFLVYDFGGGTLDVSVISIEGSQIRILATEGVHQLGGNDLNACILNLILDDIEQTYKARPALHDEPLFFHDMAVRIEAAKISLCTRPEVPIVAAYKGNQVIVRLTQPQFHKMIDPYIDQSLEAVDRAVAAAGLTPDKINSLVMVGGTSRFPHIQKRLAEHTKLTPKTDIDPVKAIAFGGVMACMAELAQQGRTATLRGRTIPAPNIFIQEVTAHGVGCGIVDTSGVNKRHINAVIIPKNTPIPCRKTDAFFLEHDDQTEARVEILQGEADAERDTCLLIGELVLDQLPKEALRSARILVDYMIDTNGMVTATATDRVSGKQKTVSVDYKKGIKPKDKPHFI